MSRSIESQLAKLREQSLFRRLREMDSPQQPTSRLAEREMLNFSSNDYLGLANDELLRNAAKVAIDEYGVGAGASRLVCGTMTPHLRLEEKLAAFKRTEAALTFSSGYATAVGTISALLREGDVAILDKLAHASLIDGAKLSGAVIRIFPHNHLGKLESHLQWAREHHPDARVLVVSESVFSMDGDCSPLAEIVELKDRYGAMLLLDEAHAVGVIGKHGRGLAERLGVASRVDVQMGTLSKAIGVSGGYICGSRALIDLLINRARSFVYSTAPSPLAAAAASASINFLESADGEARRQKLWRNLRHFAESEIGAANEPSKTTMAVEAANRHRLHPTGILESAIIPVILGDESAALSAAQTLAEQGFFVPAIRYPTVARGTARLRITISASHTESQIARLVEALAKLAR